MRQRLRVLDGGVEIEAAVGVDGKFLAVTEHAQNRINATQIFVERSAANLLLHDRVAAVEIAAHFVFQLPVVLARVVVTARRVHENLAVRLTITVTVSQQLEQRLAFDLCYRIPDRHVDGADRDRPLTMAARLFVLEHGRPDLVRIEVVARVVDERGGIGFDDARDKALAHQLALAVTAVGIEAVTHNRLAVPDHIGHHGDETQRHLAEINVGIADGGADRNGQFADFNDSHGGVS